MTYYRLLRDNKETGPFAEDEMIAKGFKPYDLIWVEGKSAGWRYPSEIPVFKNYAPAIEEQPYDRFYKKQPAQKLFSAEERQVSFKNTVSEKNIPSAKKESETVQPQQFPSIAASQSTPDYTIQPLPGRHIHVTLPSGNTVNLTTLVAKKENKELKESSEATNYTPQAQTKQPAYTEPVYREVEPVAKQADKKVIAAAPAEMISDDINTSYTEQQFESRPAQGFSWGLIAASFIGFATLVGLGIMIGLGIGKGKSEAALNEALKNKDTQTVQPSYNANNNKPAALPDDPSVTDESLQPATTPGKELVQNAVVKNVVPADNNNELKETKKIPVEKAEANKLKPLTGTDVPVVTNKPVPVVINVEKSLSLTANDFKTGAFGGISGLRYSLFNGSKFPLESVEVEIDYIQANDKIFKTEKLLFKDIPAGTQATVDAPSSTRGVKLSTRIIKVNAKEAGLTNTTAKS